MNNTQLSDFPTPIGNSEIRNEEQEQNMTTQKQLEANRLNAQQSTGPKSLEGKAAVSTNPLKHGVFSRQVVLEGESKKEFESLKIEFYEQFRPAGLLEQLFCERALAAAWRLLRVTQMESMLINYAASGSYSNGIIEVLSGNQGGELALLSRYEISLEKILFRSLAELKALQAEKRKDGLEIGFVPQNLAGENIEEKVV